MRSYDRGSSLFWLLISISVCIESLRLGIGTAKKPGMGFIAFGASGLLGILSIILFLQTFSKKGKVKVVPLFSGTLWKRVLLVLFATLMYASVMPLVGYLVSTFILMAFLFWILERRRVWWVLVLSFLATGITYYVFSVVLKCQFPYGVFGF